MVIKQNGERVVKVRQAISGLLLGTAMGDALGLPAENLSPEKIRRRWRGEWKIRLFFGKGMVSDDTEHTLMVAQALLAHDNDVDSFQRALAWKLRWWFAALPGGVGLATARACIKLWLGFPLSQCGVMSAGSGPAMRSAIIGAYFAGDAERRKSFVLASTRLTHRSWQAEAAALAVAEVAALTINGCRDFQEILGSMSAISAEPEWRKIISVMGDSLAAGETVNGFARRLGLQRGVTGYALHVVPMAIYARLLHGDDFRAGLIAALDCGGDTDTVGAIVGALMGVSAGEAKIPGEWLNNIWEWPRSVSYIKKIAERMAEQKSSGRRVGPVNYFWPAVVMRNLFFLVVILVHGLRRLLPPY